jgi:hypothetical protein
MMSASGKRLTVTLGNSDQVGAALQAVLDLHHDAQLGVKCQGCGSDWPCATITAVDQHMHWPPAHRTARRDG